MSDTHAGPPQPPAWAGQTVREPDRIIHERLSALRPTAYVDFVEGPVPTEVSISVADVSTENAWERRAPTVQVEGGSYSLEGARQLYRALREVLSAVADGGPAL